MLGGVTKRIDRAQRSLHRVTPMPLLVRSAIALCGVLAVGVAYPVELVTTRYVLPSLVLAVLPALLPRGRATSVAVAVIVGGWILDTTYYDRPVVLWRVLALATLLYLAHTTAALAAVLPYDALVRSDVVSAWLARAGAVVLGSAVLSVFALALADRLAGPALLAATMIGLAAAVTLTVLLTRLLRRP